MKKFAHLKSRSWQKSLRLTNIRIVSQMVFLSLFMLSLWASWTSRIANFPVSRLLELDPLVMISTFISTGYVYRYLGYATLLVLLTLIWGRVFCNWICPYGSLHQFIGWLFTIRNAKQRIHRNRYHPAFFFKYGVLTATLILAALGSLQIGLLDPICLLYRSFTVALIPLFDSLLGLVDLSTWQFKPSLTESRVFFGVFGVGLLFLTLIALNIFIPRFFCRLLCPLGAFLGVLSRWAIFRINRDVKKCTDCNLCLTRCEGASDPQSTLRLSECFGCMNCLDDCPEDALAFTARHLDKQVVHTTPDFSKRQLMFSSLAGGLIYPLLKQNAGQQDHYYRPSLIRPPGSTEESLFLKKCIKCDQCINVCPTNVLQPATLVQGGIEGLWTPVMNFNISHCQLKCTLCSEVCPTGAITQISAAQKLGLGDYQIPGPIRLGTAFFDRGRCLPHAMEIPCVVCQEVCPVAPKAIGTKDEEIINAFGKTVILNKPFMIPDLCIGCGLCQAECPVRDQRAVYVTAIGESRSKRRLLLQQRKNRLPTTPVDTPSEETSTNFNDSEDE